MLKLSVENEALLQHLKNLHSKGELFGMFENIPKEVYHHPECPGVSKSNLDVVDECYSDYLASLEEAKEEIEEIDFRDKFFKGHAYHLLVLETELFYKTYAVEPLPPQKPECDRRTTVGKNIYENYVNTVLTPWEKTVLSPWIQENGEKIRLPIELWNELHDLQSSCVAHPKIKWILDNSLKEVTFFGRDEKTGLTIKCQVDAISLEHRFVCDFKSTFDASFLSFRKSIAKFKYDKQAAFYLNIIKQCLGADFTWLFVASRKKSGLKDKRPVISQPYCLVKPAIEIGEALYRRSLDTISECHRGVRSFGYSSEIVDIDLPAYAYDITSR